MNVDPELRKRVEQIKSSPVQVYREAGDYNRSPGWTWNGWREPSSRSTR